MDNGFDIIKYIAGLTNHTFDKAVLERIALERDVFYVTDFSFIDESTRELLKADCLLTVYEGATTTSAYSVQDGAFKENIGSQSVLDMKRIYNILSAIYKKYNDPKLSQIEGSTGQLSWVNEDEFDR